VLACRLTKQLPKEELYALSAQIRTASASIPANIAEGYGRESSGAYLRHFRIAQGSLKELETDTLLAHRTGLVDEPAIAPVLESIETVGNLLRGHTRSIAQSS
jgi:four helix bundle protein